MFEVGEKVIFVYDPISEESFYVERRMTVCVDRVKSITYRGYNLSKTKGGGVIHFGVNESLLKEDTEYRRIKKLKQICSRLVKR